MRQEVFDRAAQWLHQRGTFAPDMMDEEPLAELVRETYGVLREGMAAGVADSIVPPAMARKLDNSVFLFSGFKTAQQLKEASTLLRRRDGTVKGFSEFLTDVRRIDANYNVRYLEAEYRFAVSSAQMAASWAEVEREGDRYDLRYRTAGDSHVREEHRPLNGVTLPPSNEFWRYYYPPNGWGCRCTAVQVRKGKYPTSDAGQAMEAGRRTTDTPKKRIFRFNPGIDGQLFPPKHPYYKLSKAEARQVEQAVGKMAQANRIEEMMAELPDNLTAEEKRAIAEHNVKLEEALGITKGKPMTVEQADRQSANPRYVPEFIPDTKGNYRDTQGNRYRRNPAYKKEDKQYSINCATCTPAYMLRVRGFDITAKGNVSGSGSLNEYVAYHWYALWKDIDGRKVQPALMTDWLREKGYKQMNPKRYAEFFDDNCKEEGIYALGISWKNGGGHATILQRFADGSIKHIEPQVYDEHLGAARDMTDLCMKGKAKPYGNDGVLRIDNKLFDTAYASLFNK